MGTIPVVAFLVALFSVLFYYTGLEDLVFIPMVLTLLLAIWGLIVGHHEKPVSSRVACVLAFLLSLVPLGIPVVQDFRIGILERKRATETAPVYTALEKEIDALRPQVLEYYRLHQVMPDFNGREPLPFIDGRGVLRQRPPAGFSVPADPFSPEGNALRLVGVRDEGVLFVSVGQTGVAEMPLPGVLMDGPPAHPLVGFAMIGQDPRLVTYDPTNGALGLGDVVRYEGRSAYEETFAPLFSAWDEAHRRSPWKPTQKRRAAETDPDPQSDRDAQQAERLLEERNYLAALALSARALQHRDPYPAQWKQYDRRIGLIRGIALYNLAAFREAADSIIDYLVESPNDATAHFYLAGSLFFGGNIDAARAHAAAAAQIDPNDPISSSAEARLQELMTNRPPGFPPPGGIQPPQN